MGYVTGCKQCFPEKDATVLYPALLKEKVKPLLTNGMILTNHYG